MSRQPTPTFIRGRKTVAQLADASSRPFEYVRSGDVAEQETAIQPDGESARGPSRADGRGCQAKHREPVR
jgi:hypothetical protein